MSSSILIMSNYNHSGSSPQMLRTIQALLDRHTDDCPAVFTASIFKSTAVRQSAASMGTNLSMKLSMLFNSHWNNYLIYTHLTTTRQ